MASCTVSLWLLDDTNEILPSVHILQCLAGKVDFSFGWAMAYLAPSRAGLEIKPSQKLPLVQPNKLNLVEFSTH